MSSTRDNGSAWARIGADRRVLGIDVGGTAMKGVLLSADGRYETVAQRETPRHLGPDAVVDAVLATVEEWVRAAQDVAAVGLVVPGLVDERSGVALYSENIGWRDVPFRELMAARTGLPVGFGHDVRAGGLAERQMGAGQGEDDLLFMPLGTGVSGAMVIDGHVIDNKYAGEIGHLDVGSGLPCACGSRGCLETVCTGPSIARAYTERSGHPAQGAKLVFERAQAGDQDAQAVVEGAIDALAAALAAYVTLLAPDVVIVGGGLAEAGDQLLQPLSAKLFDRLVWQPRPRIVRAALGEWAAGLGAALLALDAGAFGNAEAAQ